MALPCTWLELEVMMKSTTPLPSVRCSERHIPQFSVLILGGLMCGKTCIYTRYLRQEFAGDTGPTLGELCDQLL